VGVRKLIHKSD